MRKEKIISGEHVIQRGSLAAGMYFYQVSERGKIIASGKMVAE